MSHQPQQEIVEIDNWMIAEQRARARDFLASAGFTARQSGGMQVYARADVPGLIVTMRPHGSRRFRFFNLATCDEVHPDTLRASGGCWS